MRPRESEINISKDTVGTRVLTHPETPKTETEEDRRAESDLWETHFLRISKYKIKQKDCRANEPCVTKLTPGVKNRDGRDGGIFPRLGPFSTYIIKKKVILLF